jgi:plasmid maintenance system antidote protein VapI
MVERTRARALMMERGMSVTEVAVEAHTGRADTSVVVNGKRVPGRRVAARIAGALGWEGEPSELFRTVRFAEVDDGE